MLASLCFTMFCIFGSPAEGQTNPPPFTLSLAQEAISKGDFTERLLIGEQYRAFAGIVAGPYNLTPFMGYFPLTIKTGPITLNGGASLATGSIPLGGTRANWTARLHIKLAGPLGIEYWHFSNARSAIPNPSLDALSIAFSWKNGPKGDGAEPCRGRFCPPRIGA